MKSFVLGWVVSFVAVSVLPAATLDLGTATIPELQQAYDAGLTAEQVVGVYLRRIAAYDQAGPKLNAILTLNPRACEEARALDAERRARGPRSPLHGVPILVKDNFDTFDLPTTGGARALAGTYAAADAFAIARLRAAGAIILAKTNLDEFARGATGTSSLGGQTLNPYNLEKIPGGSSSGSAVGVAALFGWAAVGTETGSSIRNPATKCSLVGFCPTEGLVSRHGIIPQSPVVDRAGPIARNVTDAAILLSVMAGMDPADLATQQSLGRTATDHYQSALQGDGLQGMRLGVLRQLFGAGTEDQPAVALVDAALASLRGLGAELVDPLDQPGDLWRTVRAISGGDGADRRVALEHYFSSRGPGFQIKTLPALLAHGGYLGRLRERYENDLKAPDLSTNTAYRANLAARYALQKALVELMDREKLDALVYPVETKPARTLQEEAPEGGAVAAAPDNRGVGRGNTISPATGLPAITVPVGVNEDGVGVSLEFLGRNFAEATLVRLAHACEEAGPSHRLPDTTPLLGGERITYGDPAVEAGLVGIVFDNPALAKPVRVWTVAEPRAGLFAPIARRDFSLSLRGRLAVPFAGEFELRAEADDGLRLRLDRRMVIDGWQADGVRTGRAQAPKAGAAALEIDYVQDGGPMKLQLFWRAAGAADWQPVPRSAFSHTVADRAAMESRFAALFAEFEQVVVTAANPQPGRLPELSFVRQGPRDLLRVAFPGPAGLTFDAWMYESEVELIGVKDAGEGRLEVRHRFRRPEGGEIVSVVSANADAIEVVARTGDHGKAPGPLNLCWQLRRAPAFGSYPEPYARFAHRCFVFTAAGRTFLHRTKRLPTTRFSADDPVNNPPWVQVYLPAGSGNTDRPFPWAGVSPDRITATVAGVVSRDGRWLAALANDNATSISLVWIDCFHNNPEWHRPAGGGAPEWRLKIYLLPNDPAALLRRVGDDFPAIRTQPAFTPAAGPRAGTGE